MANYADATDEAKSLHEKFVRSFLSRELRACVRATYRYDVEIGARSLDWSIPVNFFRL